MDRTPLSALESIGIDRPMILFIGEDQSVADQILERLLGSGYKVRVVATMSAAWRTVVQLSPVAVVIDATQPAARWRPWELCRDLAGCHRFPVILVFDGEDDAAARARALEHGADQCYRVGPGICDELTAYIERRRSRLATSAVAQQLAAPEGPKIRIDWETRQVVRGGRVVSLSPKEFALLQLLNHHAGHVVSEREILKALWKRTRCPAARANLKQVVKHLRSKIETDPQHPQCLVNIRGLGYCLKADLTNGPGIDDR